MLQEALGQLPRRSQRRSRHQTQSEWLADRFLIDFGSMRGNSEVRFVLVFTVFFRCRTFGALIARRLEKSRKTAVSDSKIEAPGVLGRLGGASLSAKTAKSSEKTRSKCLRGFRKFISQRKRGNFERESAPSAPEERRDLRSPPKPRLELSLWIPKKLRRIAKQVAQGILKELAKQLAYNSFVAWYSTG